jgi:hypothetical protein
MTPRVSSGVWSSKTWNSSPGILRRRPALPANTVAGRGLRREAQPRRTSRRFRAGESWSRPSALRASPRRRRREHRPDRPDVRSFRPVQRAARWRSRRLGTAPLPRAPRTWAHFAGWRLFRGRRAWGRRSPVYRHRSGDNTGAMHRVVTGSAGGCPKGLWIALPRWQPGAERRLAARGSREARALDPSRDRVEQEPTLHAQSILWRGRTKSGRGRAMSARGSGGGPRDRAGRLHARASRRGLRPRPRESE